MSEVKSFLTGLLLVLLCLTFVCEDAHGQAGTLIVKLRKPIEACDWYLEGIATRSTIHKISDDQHIYAINHFSKAHLSADPAVEYIEESSEIEWRDTPNDLYYDDQWAIAAIGADNLWKTTTGGSTADGGDIVVAIIDKGFDIKHLDLRKNIWINHGEVPDDGIDNDQNGYRDDYHGVNIMKGNDAHDPHLHGTSVLGIIGGVGNNNIGIAGINWSIQMLPISKGGNSSLYTQDLYEMYEYILQQKDLYISSGGSQGANIVVCNASLGITGASPESYPLWCNYMDELGKRGILIANATTNQHWDVDALYDMPISCASQYIIGVTNSNQAGALVHDAGFGVASIDLAAPGQGILTTQPGDQFGSFSGTSASSPQVAGAIALLYSTPCNAFAEYARSQPKEAALAIKKHLLEGASQDVGLRGSVASSGVLNVFDAHSSLQQAFCGVSTLSDQLVIKSFYPNMVGAGETIKIEIEGLQPASSLLIYNSLGGLISQQTLELQGNIPIYLNLDHLQLAAGMYFISIQSGKQAITRRIVHR